MHAYMQTHTHVHTHMDKYYSDLKTSLNVFIAGYLRRKERQ